MEEKKLTGYPSVDKPWLKYYSEEAIRAPIPDCTVYEYLWESNKDNFDDIALIYFGRKISYKTLFMKIDMVENALRTSGVKYGDIVTISLPSTPEVVYLQYALSKIGAIANMIDPRSDAKMLKHYLDEAESSVFIFLDKCAPIVQKVIGHTKVKMAVRVSATESLPFINFLTKLVSKPITTINAVSWKSFTSNKSRQNQVRDKEERILMDTPTLMTHTSGTTGLPKGVVLSHRNVNAVVHQYSVGMKHSRGQKYLCVIPPFIAFGVCVAIHLPLGLGMSVILVPQFNAQDFAKYLKKYQPEHFTCAPMSMEPLIKEQHKLDLSFLVTPSVGGDYISAEYEKRINAYLSEHGCKHLLVKGYGMTEVSSSACTTSDYCNEAGSVGIPLVNMTISVFQIGTTTELSYGEEGEICFTGPNVMQGYFNNTAATRAALKVHKDGMTWMHSGDIGYMTPDGHIFVIDRLKRTVTVDGHMVLPSKIEHVLLKHSSVEKCAVVGNKQSRLIAYIVLKEGCFENVQKEFQELCASELPTYSHPVFYVFKDGLPLTPVGKVDYRALELEAQKC